MAEHWSVLEVEAIVDDYFAMLAAELRGEVYSKAAHRRALQLKLSNRSEQSIEFKHSNISAVLNDLGHIAIDGYKPRANYQALLFDVVAESVSVNQPLKALELAAVDKIATYTDIALTPVIPFVPAPTRDVPKRVYEHRNVVRRGVLGINYLEREARNVSLGAAGESIVLNLEHQRLWTSGNRKLADRIEHVSKTQGDGLGYDILSFESSGKERLIEVKTTRFGQFTPFFATQNEVSVSDERREEYQVFRLFKFDTAPQIFTLTGSMRESTHLDPLLYRASVR